MGDVSPKHHVGVSRLEVEYDRKSNSKPLSNINFHPNTEAMSAIADSNLSAKGCLPCLSKFVPKVGDVTSKVGDVSPKHHVGVSRLEVECGRKSNSKPLSNINFHPNTEAMSAIADSN
ncbi:MAG: hypothetical protein LBI18_09575, partial [Planctomycetaceae bacterium]|nr:hypothetical protein [Planctomycetaceae bacterium]